MLFELEWVANLSVVLCVEQESLGVWVCVLGMKFRLLAKEEQRSTTESSEKEKRRAKCTEEQERQSHKLRGKKEEKVKRAGEMVSLRPPPAIS